MSDLRVAWRRLQKQPGASALIVFFIASALGLNIVLFSIVRAALFRAVPYDNPSELVDIVQGRHQRFFGPLNMDSYALLEEQASSDFQEFARYREEVFQVSRGGFTTALRGASVSANAFRLLGVAPRLGRSFRFDEEASSAGVTVISSRIWRTWFGASDSILGETIEIDGIPHTVVGVMPAGFQFYDRASIWVPLPPDTEQRFGVVARLQPSVTIDSARQTLTALAGPLLRLLPRAQSDSSEAQTPDSVTLQPLDQGAASAGLVAIATLLQLAATLVLCVAAANLASVFLARGLARRNEVAVRQALGASHGRIARFLFAESLVLCSLGLGVGVLFALWSRDLVVATVPFASSLALVRIADPMVLGFAIALALSLSTVTGALPGLSIARSQLFQAVRAGGYGSSRDRKQANWQRRLIVVQVALSTVLMVGGVLAMRNVVAISDADPGFDARQVFRFLVEFPDSYYSNPPALEQSVQGFIRAGESSPAVRSIAWYNRPPAEITGDAQSRRNGYVETSDGPSRLHGSNRFIAVSPSYFRTFGIPIVRGRGFDGVHDGPNTPLVAIVSERAASILWPGRDPLGKEIRFPGSLSALTVVGVSGDVVRLSSFAHESASRQMRLERWPDIYLSATQYKVATTTLFYVRPVIDRGVLNRTLQDIVSTVHSNARIVGLRTVYEAEYERTRQLFADIGRVIIGVGGLALFLAVLGIYAVASFSYMQRRREVGIRVALGARRGDVYRLLMLDNAKAPALGGILGLVFSLLAFRVGADFFPVSGPWVVAIQCLVAVGLVIVVVSAAIVPARRTTLVAPVDVLREN